MTTTQQPARTGQAAQFSIQRISGFSGSVDSSVTVILRVPHFVPQDELLDEARRQLNSHAALVEALEGAEALMQGVDCLGILPDGERIALLYVQSAVRAALALAKEGRA